MTGGRVADETVTMPTELLRELLGLEPSCDFQTVTRRDGAVTVEKDECGNPARWIMTAYGNCGHPCRSALCEQHHEAMRTGQVLAACPTCKRTSWARRSECEHL